MHSAALYEDVELFTSIALNTGARVGTILNIKLKDIDLSNMTINLYDFKNESSYIGFINEELEDKICIYFKYPLEKLRLKFVLGDREKFIFPINRTVITRKLKAILDELFNYSLAKDDRKNRAVVHTLRHTFASHLAINGTPLPIIQKLMNHKSIEMTMRYAKLLPDTGREFTSNLWKKVN